MPSERTDSWPTDIVGHRTRSIRHDQLIQESKLAVLNRLVGVDGDSGELETQVKELRENAQRLQTLTELTQPDEAEIERSCSTELLLFSSLDQKVRRGSETTLWDVARRVLLRVGCTTGRLTDSVRKNGIVVGDRRRFPHEFAHCEPASVADGLVRAAEQFLGITDDAWTVSLDGTSTGLAALATLTPLCPELIERTKEAIPALVQLSTPYAEYRPLRGVSPNTLRFLYCAESERAQWVRVLGHVMLSERENTEDYSLRNPWAVILEQRTISAPIGNYRQAWRWLSRGNSVRRRRIVEPLLDRYRLVEFRELDDPFRDFDGCVKLLEAAQAAMCVYPVNSGRLAFSGNDPRLRPLFFETSLKPEWVKPGRIHELTTEGDFVRLLHVLFPELVNIKTVCLRLSNEDDSKVVTDRLVHLGVLEECSGRFRITRVPPRLMGRVDEELFALRYGDVVGLSRDEMISALLESDRLYNAVHWPVFDAYELGHITRNDVPDSIAALSDSLRR